MDAPSSDDLKDIYEQKESMQVLICELSCKNTYKGNEQHSKLSKRFNVIGGLDGSTNILAQDLSEAHAIEAMKEAIAVGYTAIKIIEQSNEDDGKTNIPS